MIKSKFDTSGLSIKIGYLFSNVGLSANTWTLLALFPAILGFISLYYGNLTYGLILFILSGAIDAIDGSVARVTDSVSNLGAFLDGVIDRYVELLMYFGLLFYLQEYNISIWILLLVFGAIMPTFVRAYAHHRGVVTEPEDLKRMGGLVERFERLMLIYIGLVLGIFNVIWLVWVVMIVAVLSNLTALQRILFVVRFSK